MTPFTTITTIFLGLLALMQLTRFVMGWGVSVNGMTIPVWISAIALVIAGALALTLWKENRR
ncbi:MAG: hypothetical protein LH470_08770 [Lysobacter sp.]|nr:hypothetical protein [Lysobacter sp.]